MPDTSVSITFATASDLPSVWSIAADSISTWPYWWV
jgi:hypothetical protein